MQYCGFVYEIEKMHYSPNAGWYYWDHCAISVKEYEIAHNGGIPIDSERRNKRIEKMLKFEKGESTEPKEKNSWLINCEIEEKEGK